VTSSCELPKAGYNPPRLRDSGQKFSLGKFHLSDALAWAVLPSDPVNLWAG